MTTLGQMAAAGVAWALAVLACALVGVTGLAWSNARRIRRQRVRLNRLLRRYERAESDLLSLRKQHAAQVASSLDTPKGTIDFRSQFGEDLYLWELFDGKRTGFYVEVGAFDGHDQSVTWAFEKIGWVGLLVEAIPERADQCRTNRPKSTVVHTALGQPDSPDSIEFTVVQGGPSAAMLSYDPKRSRTTEHIEIIRTLGASTRTVRVPMRTMDSVLDELAAQGRGPTDGIDFAVIDVEGAELSLLKGWDLDRWRPRVLIVEDNTMGRDSAVLEYLRSRGYTDVMPLGINIVFVRTDESALLERARTLAELVPWPNFGMEFGTGIGAGRTP
ncbi:MAG: FkbM family methyltransferase [Planctomycetes bacterium]|nr:FkbM family methyltransferase [Planctomycetota bacterium]